MPTERHLQGTPVTVKAGAVSHYGDKFHKDTPAILDRLTAKGANTYAVRYTRPNGEPKVSLVYPKDLKDWGVPPTLTTATFKDILNPTITTIAGYLTQAVPGELREYEFPAIGVGDDTLVLTLSQLGEVTRITFRIPPTSRSITLAEHLEAGFPKTVFINLSAAELRNHCIDRINYLCKLADVDPAYIYWSMD